MHSSGFEAGAALEPSTPKRNRQSERKVSHSERHVALKIAECKRGNLLGIQRQFLEPNNGEERRILDQRGELPAEWREYVPERLREDHETIGLHRRQPNRPGAFELRSSNAFDSRPKDFT